MTGFVLLSAGLARAQITLGEAVDNTSLTWTTGGNADWVGVNTTTHDGTDSAESGSIGALGKTWIETVVPESGILTFFWKVSSEGCKCDVLRFYIDGGIAAGGEIWGNVDWRQETFELAPGPHTLKWEYSKDFTLSGGQDRGWLDEVSFAPKPWAEAPPSMTVPALSNLPSYDVSWSASPTGGASYVLEEATDAAFTTGLRQVSSGTALSATVTGRADGTYYYRVKTVASGHFDSPWTNGSNGCLVDLPSASPPPGITVPTTDGDGDYVVSWQASVSNGVSYVLEEATDGSFTAGLREAYSGPDVSATITGRANGATYYYRVKATGMAYKDSVWTEGGNGCVVVFPPAGTPAGITVPVSDNDGAYQVTWGPSSTSGVTYVLEEATDAAFGSDLRIAHVGTALSADIANRVTGNTYFYRVKAIKGGFSDSAWMVGGNGCQVDIPAEAPQGITVPALDNDGDYTISWQASNTPGVDYVLEEATDAAFTTGLQEVYRGQALSVSIGGKTDGMYYYRVKATGNGYLDSPWMTGSNGCEVILTIVSTPGSVIVPTGSLTHFYTVSWGASSTSGVTYVLQEALDTAFTLGVRTVHQGSASSATITDRTDGTYYYRVKAIKSGFIDSSWAEGPNGCAVEIYPLEDALDNTALIWATGGNGEWFAELTETSDGVDAAQSRNIGSTQTSWVMTTVPDGGTLKFFWKVSSEFCCDFLNFYVDDMAVPVEKISGSQDWTQESFTLSAGAHTLKWEYEKDFTVSGGADTGWLDQVEYVSSGLPFASPPLSITVPPSDADGAYTILWEASSTDGVIYVLEEATDSAFTADVRTAYVGTAQEASITGKTHGVTYYYRVKATKTDHIDSTWTTGANGCLMDFPASPPPTLTVPATDSDGAYTVSWSASITNGVSYVLEEATDPAFTADLQEVYSGTGLSAGVTGREHGKTYYYRVRATGGGHGDSAWTVGANGCAVSYPPAEPPSGITVPAADSDGAYTINWGASITNGVSYVLEEATDAAFTADLQEVYSGAGLSAPVTGKATGVTYYYRVKATGNGYSDSPWVEGGNGCAVRFQAGAPSSVSVPPSDGDGDYDVTWGASITNGVTYVVEEAADSGFSTGLAEVYRGPDLSVSIGGRPDGTYYYRVKAVKADFDDSDWTAGGNGCDVTTLVQMPASITVPASDSDGVDITVSWGPSVTSGVIYILEEATDSLFTDAVGVYAGTDLSTVLTRPTGETYYYRVKAEKAGDSSAWRVGGNGCLVPTGEPSSITVPANDNDGIYQISWGASITNAPVYILQEATDSAFTTGVLEINKGSALNHMVSGKPDGTYYYRVKAVKSIGTDSAWVQGANGCVVDLPDVAAPASITVPPGDGDGDYVVSWDASLTNGVSYVLEEATDSAFAEGLRVAYQSTGTSAAILGRTTGKTYYYRVKATAPGHTPSAWTLGSNGCQVSIPVGAPASISVPASDTDGAYIVLWGASSTPGATYVLEEATDSSFATGLREAYRGSGLSTSITGRTDGIYYYRVKAVKTDYADSSWMVAGNPCDVVLPPQAEMPPSLTVPASSNTGFYTITWQPSGTANVVYVVEESTDSTFSTGAETVYIGTSLQTLIVGKGTGTTYFYRAKAIKGGMMDSEWVEGGNGCSVLLPADAPLSISVPATDDDGTFDVSWQPSNTPGATYVLEEATDSAFATGLRTAYSGAGLSATISGRADETAYYYRVKAVKQDYDDSAWTVANNACFVDFPKAEPPSSIAVPPIDDDGNYTISWGPSSTAGAKYVLEESTDSTFVTGSQIIYSDTGLSFAVTGRTHGETYYYRVKAAARQNARRDILLPGESRRRRFPGQRLGRGEQRLLRTHRLCYHGNRRTQRHGELSA
jgi:hypothetical protein